MKVLYVGYRYEFGNPENGDAINYLGWHNGLKKLGYTVEGLFYDNAEPIEIKQRLNERIVQFQPDVVFVIPQHDRFPSSLYTSVVPDKPYALFGFFGDDQWRFETFSKYYSNKFDLIITTDFNSVEKYKQCGAQSVFLSQWAALSDLCINIEDCAPLKFKFDVTFVGAKSRYREWFVNRLKKDGIAVVCYGDGWNNGRINYEEMSLIARQSKISLNISNSLSHDIRFIFSSIPNFLSYIKSRLKIGSKNISQMKARNFEIPGYGGFQLTEYVPDLERYWNIGAEICCYTDYDECLLMVNHWLKNEDEREFIRKCGNKRAITEHTYVSRLINIFGKIV